jgi:hypothetical protein
VKIPLPLLLLCAIARGGPIECIQAGVEHVYVDLGVYTLMEPLIIPSNVTIFCEPGAVFEAAPGAFLGVHDSLVVMENSTNVAIHNCEFRMRKSDYQQPPYELSEFRHAINLRGASNVSLFSVGVFQSGGDGICIEALVSGPFSEDRKPSKNVTIERLTAKGNYRTGLAVVSADGLTVRDSLFEGTKGTSTNAGVNCEPSHGGDQLKDILFERCTARENGGSAFRVNMDRQNQNSKPVSVEFRDCIAERVPIGHSIIMLNEWGYNLNSVKPKGRICWDASCQTNP